MGCPASGGFVEGGADGVAESAARARVSLHQETPGHDGTGAAAAAARPQDDRQHEKDGAGA